MQADATSSTNTPSTHDGTASLASAIMPFPRTWFTPPFLASSARRHQRSRSAWTCGGEKEQAKEECFTRECDVPGSWIPDSHTVDPSLILPRTQPSFFRPFLSLTASPSLFAEPRVRLPQHTRLLLSSPKGCLADASAGHDGTPTRISPPLHLHLHAALTTGTCSIKSLDKTPGSPLFSRTAHKHMQSLSRSNVKKRKQNKDIVDQEDKSVVGGGGGGLLAVGVKGLCGLSVGRCVSV